MINLDIEEDEFEEEDDLAEFENNISLQKDFILWTKTDNYFNVGGLICQ